jgi:hypothetical protein
MKERCCCPSHKSYRWYGARGIEVCERWRGSFAAFYSDMGDRPSPQHSIDRIDPDGNYEPGNCRWVTASEQGRSRRRSQLSSFAGNTYQYRDPVKRACAGRGGDAEVAGAEGAIGRDFAPHTAACCEADAPDRAAVASAGVRGINGNCSRRYPALRRRLSGWFAFAAVHKGVGQAGHARAAGWQPPIPQYKAGHPFLLLG